MFSSDFSSPHTKKQAYAKHSRGYDLDDEIDAYFRAFAQQAGKPFNIRDPRVDPAHLRETVTRELKAAEASIGFRGKDEVRQRIAELIDLKAAPFVRTTGSFYLDLRLAIGKNLDGPTPREGLSLYIVTDPDKNQNNRLQLIRHITAGGVHHKHSNVEIGMSIYVRPGTVSDEDPVDASGKHKFSRNHDQFAPALLAIPHLRHALSHAHDAAKAEVIETKNDLLPVLEILNVILLEEQLTEEMKQQNLFGQLVFNDAELDLSQGAVPFIDQFNRAFENLRHVSPELGVAIEHFMETLQAAFSVEHDPRFLAADNVGASISAHPTATVINSPISQEAAEAATKLLSTERADSKNDDQPNSQPDEPHSLSINHSNMLPVPALTE